MVWLTHCNGMLRALTGIQGGYNGSATGLSPSMPLAVSPKSEIRNPLSKICELASWERRAHGVYDCRQIDDLLRNRSSYRRQVAQQRSSHAEDTQRHAAHGALERDRAHAPADVDQLVDLRQRCLQD